MKIKCIEENSDTEIFLFLDTKKTLSIPPSGGDMIYLTGNRWLVNRVFHKIIDDEQEIHVMLTRTW